MGQYAEPTYELVHISLVYVALYSFDLVKFTRRHQNLQIYNMN